jgi:CheY-like chemotaxis protein
MDVLIVDDDEAVRKAFSRALERAGYMVTAGENGMAEQGA